MSSLRVRWGGRTRPQPDPLVGLRRAEARHAAAKGCPTRRVLRLFTFVLFAAALSAQTFYPFAIDQDNLTGAPDFSFLNHPLDASDRLFVRDGHFYRVGPDLAPNTEDDERVRLFGVNLAFGANFPAQSDAARIAKRLRRLGVNLVRLHHMDSQPDSNPQNANSLLTTGPYPTLNQVAAARLRVFLDALEAEGIYANLNLHVGYTFRPSVDGMPPFAGAAFPTQSKPLHIFHPRMVDLQVEYTRKIIDALKLKDDPVLGMVEIDNESSLVREWQAANLDRNLLGEYRTELQRQWNAWLALHYESTQALRESWGGGEPDGQQLLGNNWQLELHAPGQATRTADGDTVIVRVTNGGDVVILKLVGFSITLDRPYLAEVEMRADLPDGASRSIYWDIKQDVNPWRTATNKTVSVTNQWQKFTMSLQPAFAMDRIGRFGLSVEKVDAPLYVRNWGLRQVARRGLADGESMEAANIALVGEDEIATQRRTDDYLLFLADSDRAYLEQMLPATRESAGVLVPVAGTQMGYGGLLNLDSHAGLDYQDNHFYIDHYSFPNVAWDGRDWRIRDQSSLGSGLGTFTNMAAARESGRPYTVSEYNQPWPNTYGAEIDATLAIYGAFQDWDSIMHFAYSHGRNWDDGVPNGFNINGDWTKFPNVGQAAWLFRSGAIQPAAQSLDIPVSVALRLRAARQKQNGNIASFLNSAMGYNPDLALIHRTGVYRSDEATPPEAAAQKLTGPFVADTGEYTYDRDARLFLIHAPQAAGVFGFAGAKKVIAGPLDVELAPGARGFAAILVTALDGRTIAASAHLLLSTPGFTLRTQPGADPARPQTIVNYPPARDWWTLEPDPRYPQKPSGDMNGGQRPVWIERVESFVTLRTAAAALEVYPLDGAGNRLAQIEAAPMEGGFRIHLQADGQPPSPWYEIVCSFDSSSSSQ